MKTLLAVILVSSFQVSAQDQFCHEEHYRSPIEDLGLTSNTPDQLFRKLVEQREKIYLRDLRVGRILDREQLNATETYISQPSSDSKIGNNMAFRGMKESKDMMIKFLGNVFVNSYYDLVHLKADPDIIGQCTDNKCFRRIDDLRKRWMNLTNDPLCMLDFSGKKTHSRNADQEWRNVLRSIKRKDNCNEALLESFTSAIPPFQEVYHADASAANYIRTDEGEDIIELSYPKIIIDGVEDDISEKSKKLDVCRAFGYEKVAMEQSWRDFGFEDGEALIIEGGIFYAGTGSKLTRIFCK